MASDIQIRIRRDLQQKTVKAFQDLGAYTKQLTVDLCKEEAALTAREAINMSPPLDGSAGGKGDKPIAKRWGEWAVVYDVMTVVTEDSKSLAASISSSRNNRAKFDKWRMGKPPKSAGIVSKSGQTKMGTELLRKPKPCSRIGANADSISLIMSRPYRPGMIKPGSFTGDASGRMAGRMQRGS
jgi:hypothetical protein